MHIWLNLFWKEWHEQKWKLLSLMVIALSVFGAMLSQDVGNVEFALASTIFAFVMFAPTFVAMGVSAGEHASGVIRFVHAQPVPIWQVAAVRCFAGLSVLLTPILCCGLLCWLAAFVWPQSGPYSARTASLAGLPGEWTLTLKLVVLTGFGLAASVNLYAWTVAITVNQRTESRAGLIGLLVMVVLGVSGMIGLSGWENPLPNFSATQLLCLISGPLVWLGVIDFVGNSHYGLVTVAVLWQLLLTTGLLAVIVRRYGREETWFQGIHFEKLRPVSTDPSRLLPPMASPWRALLWLQLRQSIPVCIAGLAIVFAIALTTRLDRSAGVYAFDRLYPGVGCVLALLIGVGSYVSELDPKLHTFWRSRPISPSGWFWFKYVGGLVALIGLFDLPCAFLVWTGIVRTSSPGIAACFPMLLHLLCYSLAVLAACSVRHSSYSTVFAVIGALVVICLPEFPELQVPEFLSFLRLWENAARYTRYNRMTDLIGGSALVGTISLVATLTAAFLIKRDISVAP